MKRFFFPRLKTRHMTHDVAPSPILHELRALLQSGAVPEWLPVQSLVSGAGILWAARPAAATVPGQVIRITDVGTAAHGSHWVSDGTNWRPVNGRVVLASLAGSTAAPVCSVTGSTGASFAIPGGNIKVPAGLLLPGAQLEVRPVFRRVGANATGNVNVTIGTSQSASDSNLVAQGLAATTNLDFAPDPRVFVSSATVITSTAWLQVGGGTGGGATLDRSANFNTAADMWVSLYTSSANAADVFQLLALQVAVVE